MPFQAEHQETDHHTTSIHVLQNLILAFQVQHRGVDMCMAVMAVMAAVYLIEIIFLLPLDKDMLFMLHRVQVHLTLPAAEVMFYQLADLLADIPYIRIHLPMQCSFFQDPLTDQLM